MMFGRQEQSAAGAKEPAVRGRGEGKEAWGWRRRKEGRRVRPGTGHWEDLLWARFENPQRLLGSGAAAEETAVARRPRPEDQRYRLVGKGARRCLRRRVSMPPHHSKMREHRFLTVFPGAPPVLPGSPAPRRCRPPHPSPAHGTLPVSEICRRYPPASDGILEVMGAGC